MKPKLIAAHGLSQQLVSEPLKGLLKESPNLPFITMTVLSDFSDSTVLLAEGGFTHSVARTSALMT